MAKDILNSLDKKDWWLLFIDSKDQYRGQKAYDNEESPGFYDSMMNAMEKFLADDNELGKKINAEKYYLMYETIAKDNKTESISQGFTDIGKQGHNSQYRTSKIEGEALEELENKKIGDRNLLSHISPQSILFANIDRNKDNIAFLASDALFIEIYKDSQKEAGIKPSSNFVLKEQAKKHSSIVTNMAYSHDEKKEIINEIFDEHYKSIDKADSNLAKIETIADTVRSLHVMHSFTDGNGRLNMPIVMNNLLCDAGFCPAILPNGPEVFGGQNTLSQLTSDTSKGMESFVRVAQNGKESPPISEQVVQNVSSVKTQLNARTIERYKNNEFKRTASSESLESFGGSSDSESEAEEKKPFVNPKDMFRRGR